MTHISALNAAPKPRRAKHAKVVYPTDQLTDAFTSVGVELEKAFTIAARETHAAIMKARENMQQKPAEQQTVTCPKCGTKNPFGSIFCHSCGAKIAPIEGSHGSA